MNRRLVLHALLAVALTTAAFGQGPKKERRGLGMLSVEEQMHLRSAHAAAMRDPAFMASHQRFQQARSEYREQLRQALLRADPSILPILEKVKRAPREQRPPF